MLGPESNLILLKLGYKIGVLYANSAASTNDISVATGIPWPSVKRYVRMVIDRKEEYIKSFPDVTEEHIEDLASKIEELIEENKKNNKWKKPEVCFSHSHYQEQIEEICQLVSDLPVKKIDDEMKRQILNLRINGMSLSKIATAVGVSKTSVSMVVNEEGKKK